MLIRLPEGNDVNTHTSMISAVTAATGISSILPTDHRTTQVTHPAEDDRMASTPPQKVIGLDPTNEACSTTQKYYNEFPQNRPASYNMAAMAHVSQRLLEDTQEDSQKLPAITTDVAAASENEAIRTTDAGQQPSPKTHTPVITVDPLLVTKETTTATENEALTTNEDSQSQVAVEKEVMENEVRMQETSISVVVAVRKTFVVCRYFVGFYNLFFSLC